jgi:hypothetical protein
VKRDELVWGKRPKVKKSVGTARTSWRRAARELRWRQGTGVHGRGTVLGRREVGKKRLSIRVRQRAMVRRLKKA